MVATVEGHDHGAGSLGRSYETDSLGGARESEEEELTPVDVGPVGTSVEAGRQILAVSNVTTDDDDSRRR
jgi:hypothetical protein